MRPSADRTRLLFTGGGGAAAEAFNRLLHDRYDVHFADADPESRPHGVPRHAWHPIPYASAPTFIEELLGLCRDLAIDLLVPGVDEELLPISHARDSFTCAVLLPPADFLSTHLDKLTSLSVLAALKLPTPATASWTDRRRIPFPCIVKPRRGRGSRHVAIARSEEALQAHVLLSGRPADDFIVQELLVGQEYTVTVAADRAGRLRAVVPVKVDLKRGITIRAATEHDEAVIAGCAAIHAASPVSGCFNVQLVKTHTGDVKTFEINPRISTTTCLALAAGVDVLATYLGDRSSAEAGEALAPFEGGLRLRRSWHNEFLLRGRTAAAQRRP